MSDLYDKVRDYPKFRLEEAKKAGIGFKTPKQLKPMAAKPKTESVRNVVQRVVPNSQSESHNHQKLA